MANKGFLNVEYEQNDLGISVCCSVLLCLLSSVANGGSEFTVLKFDTELLSLMSGIPLLGQACAFSEGVIGADGAQRMGLVVSLSQSIPVKWDGQEFFVASFFDVSFDITVTDVDDGVGRGYAGQPDSASFTLIGNGPAFVQSQSRLTVTVQQKRPQFRSASTSAVGPLHWSF